MSDEEEEEMIWENGSPEDQMFSGSDDSNDIEWEDVEVGDDSEDEDRESIDQDENSLVIISSKGTTTDTTKDTIKDKGKKKRKIRRITSKEKEDILTMHKFHLLCLLSREKKLSERCNSQELQCMALSLVPIDVHIHPQIATVSAVSALCKWFSRYFTFDTVRSSSPVHHSLESIAQSRKGPVADLMLLFVAICRGMGLDCRYVSSFQPKPLLPNSNTNAHLTEELVQFLTTDMDNDISDPQPKKRKREKKSSTRPIVTNVWAELYCLSEKVSSTTSSKPQWRWIHVDVCNGFIDQPLECEGLRGRGAVLPYVIAFQNNNRIIDVSRRYGSRWSKTRQHRLPNETWWINTLKLFKTHTTTSQPEEKTDPDESKVQQEEEILRAIVQKEPQPNSFEGFRKHHVYCLEKFLGKYECVFPKKPVGLFKGEPVYLRENVQQLRTRRQWQMQGRQVLEQQVAAKVVDNQSCESQVGNSSTGFKLYGLWQTTPIVPPIVVDGILPKNTHGNIELWSPECLPIGAVHIQLPHIAKVAKKIGIDYAQALVGFESKNGISIPKFDGIIVCAENSDLLKEAFTAMEQVSIEKTIKSNIKLVYSRWKKIVKGLLLKTRLQQDYGPY